MSAEFRRRAQFPILLHPGIHHLAQVGRLHIGDGEIVFGRKTDYAADSRLRFRQQQPVLLIAFPRRSRFESSEIVIENKSGVVLRIPHAARTAVAGAKVALRIVFRLRGGDDEFFCPARGAACGAETPAPIRE